MAWIEVPGKRSQKTKHYVDSLNDTKFQAVLTIHDQHYHDGSAWQDIDETIIDDVSIPGYIAKCDKTRHIIRFGNSGERRWYPRRNVTTEYVDTAKPDYWGGNNWKPWNLTGLIRGSNSITWETTDYKFVITNTWHRVKLDYILKTASAPPRVRFPLTLTGLTWSNGRLIGGDGLEAGRIDLPTAKDTNGVALPCTGTYASGYYEINCDVTGAAYPVEIDPTFTDGYGGDVDTAYDTSVAEALPNSQYGTSDIIRTEGLAGERWENLIKFNLSSLAGSTINSATLSMKVNNAIDAHTVVVSAILSANSGWTEDGATWNYAVASTTRWAGDTGNDGGTDAGCSVSGTDYNGTAMGTINIPNSTAAGTQFDCTLSASQVAAWLTNNYGLIMHDTDVSGTAVQWRSSDYATTGDRPKLVVNYTRYPTKVGSFNIDTAKTAGQTQAITGLGFTPKVVLFWWSGTTRTTDGAAGENICSGFGAMAGATSRICQTGNALDAAASCTSSSHSLTTACIESVLNGSTTVDGLADFSSFDADGFTLVIDDQFSVALRVSYLALGGSDLTNVYIGTKLAPTVTGNYGVTGVGFQPDAIITLNGTSNFNDGAPSGACSASIGIATGPSNQGVVGFYMHGDFATSLTKGYGYNAEISAKPDFSSIYFRDAFVSMDSDGFTLNHLEGSGTQNFGFIALKGGSYKVGTLTTRTDANDIAVTGLGFKPTGLLFLSANRALDTQDTVSANWSTSIGAATSTTNRAAQAVWNEDGLADMETATSNYDSACYANVQHDVIAGLMDIKSIDANGFTAVMDDADPSACWVTYLAIGPAATGGTTVDEAVTLDWHGGISSIDQTNEQDVSILDNHLGLTEVSETNENDGSLLDNHLGTTASSETNENDGSLLDNHLGTSVNEQTNENDGSLLDNHLGTTANSETNENDGLVLDNHLGLVVTEMVSGAPTEESVSLGIILRVTQPLPGNIEESVALGIIVSISNLVQSEQQDTVSLGRAISESSISNTIESDIVSLGRISTLAQLDQTNESDTVSLGRISTLAQLDQTNESDTVSLGYINTIIPISQTVENDAITLADFISITVLEETQGFVNETVILARSVDITVLQEGISHVGESVIIDRLVGISEVDQLQVNDFTILSRLSGINEVDQLLINVSTILNRLSGISEVDQLPVSESTILSRSNGISNFEQCQVNDNAILNRLTGISELEQLQININTILSRSNGISELDLVLINDSTILSRSVQILSNTQCQVNDYFSLAKFAQIIIIDETIGQYSEILTLSRAIGLTVLQEGISHVSESVSVSRLNSISFNEQSNLYNNLVFGRLNSLSNIPQSQIFNNLIFSKSNGLIINSQSIANENITFNKFDGLNINSQIIIPEFINLSELYNLSILDSRYLLENVNLQYTNGLSLIDSPTVFERVELGRIDIVTIITVLLGYNSINLNQYLTITGEPQSLYVYSNGDHSVGVLFRDKRLGVLFRDKRASVRWRDKRSGK